MNDAAAAAVTINENAVVSDLIHTRFTSFYDKIYYVCRRGSADLV